jgi:hypothetical protein
LGTTIEPALTEVSISGYKVDPFASTVGLTVHFAKMCINVLKISLSAYFTEKRRGDE